MERHLIDTGGTGAAMAVSIIKCASYILFVDVMSVSIVVVGLNTVKWHERNSSSTIVIGNPLSAE